MKSTFLTTAILLLGIARFAAAQAVTGDLSGQVTDENGDALYTAIITVTGSNLLQPRKAAVDEDGKFFIKFVPPGEYHVTIVDTDGCRGVAELETRIFIEVTTEVGVIELAESDEDTCCRMYAGNPAGGTVTLTVLAPVPENSWRAWVSLEGANTRIWNEERPDGANVSRFTCVPPGKYNIRICDPANEWLPVVIGVDVTEGETVDAGTIHLAPNIAGVQCTPPTDPLAQDPGNGEEPTLPESETATNAAPGKLTPQFLAVLRNTPMVSEISGRRYQDYLGLNMCGLNTREVMAPLPLLESEARIPGLDSPSRGRTALGSLQLLPGHRRAMSPATNANCPLGRQPV